MTKEEAKQKIAELVAKCQSLTSSDIKSYHEAKTKQGFIEPLFRTLGWDFDDVNEVTPEEAASKGRVDYAFKLNGVSQFYLEAKPLKADLTNPEYIKQAVTYAYNKGVTWAVLTDFHELRLFNAQKNNPFITINYEEYVAGFDKLWLLSRESLQSGLLNKTAADYGALPPSIPVETRLFKQLRQWREDLYNQLHSYNKNLSYKQIDEMIERLFNRLIFIRTCEDRNIEEKRLRSVVNQWQAGGYKGELIQAIQKIFREFDINYDSELFAKDILDDNNVLILNATLESIINGLYEVRGGMANYDFSIISADVLGRVYEQYLGYVANVVKERTKAAQAQMDLGLDSAFEIIAKKKHRKEQGIYYTPKFITDYIVKKTVGHFIKDHSYSEVRNIKILDPACGSGSFLIRAYDELLSYHAKERNKSLDELHQYDRLPVLTGNIFGVDLDMQAVEIARLNLLLRTLTEKGKLPLLSNNIRQGNSLISGTEEELKNYFGDKWLETHAFNWEDEFKDIMAKGGFDVVIGNPPYVNEARGNKELFRELKRVPKLQLYYEKNMDLFNYFIEIGLDLLRDGGILGYIIPSYWQDRAGAQLLRNKIITQANIENFIDFGGFKVFSESPGHHSSILILRKTTQSKLKRTLSYLKVNVSEISNYDDQLRVITELLDNDRLSLCDYEVSANKLIVRSSIGPDMIAAFKKKPYFHFGKNQIIRGVDTSPSSYRGKGVFVLSEAEKRKMGNLKRKEQEFLKPFYNANQVDRYFYEQQNSHWLIYTDSKRREALEKEKDDYPTFIAHLDNFKDIITSDNKPYGLHRPKKESNFLEQNKILFVRKTPYPKFAFVPIPYFFDESMYLVLYDMDANPFCLLGILNSKLAAYWFAMHKKQGNQLQIDKEIILSLPIRRINVNNCTEKKARDYLITLVNRIIELYRQLGQARETYDQRPPDLIREISNIDDKIDNLVYDLYGLTEEERKVVEEAVK